MNSSIQHRIYNIADACEMLIVRGLLVEQIGWHTALYNPRYSAGAGLPWTQD